MGGRRPYSGRRAPGRPRRFAPAPLGVDAAGRHRYTVPMSNSNLDFAVKPGEPIVSDSRCFVCGLKNDGGLRIVFYRQGDAAAVARCLPDQRFMGYDGLLHGGVAGALLDEIMIKAVLSRGRLVVTGRMTVNYHKPIRLGAPLTLQGTITRERARIVETKGTIADDEGTVLASATGIYVEVTGEQRDQLAGSLGA